MKEESFDLTCWCGCGIIRFTAEQIDKNDPEEIYVEYFASEFYSEQRSIFSILWERIVIAFKMLTGKKFRLYEVVIENKEDINKFKEWVNKL